MKDICYVCKVADYAYRNDTKANELSAYTPDVYKDQKMKTWLLFDSMQKISVDFLDGLLSDATVKDFIGQRSNNKIL